jgi:hypothetical protein
MAGKIIADTLETGAGADIATSYVVNGSAKAWINFNGTATGAVSTYARDSLNLSVTIDNGAGDYTLGFTSSMGNANYAVSGSAGYGSTNLFCMNVPRNSFAPTTTVLRVQTPYVNTTLGDCDFVAPSIHGDLA